MAARSQLVLWGDTWKTSPRVKTAAFKLMELEHKWIDRVRAKITNKQNSINKHLSKKSIFVPTFRFLLWEKH